MTLYDALMRTAEHIEQQPQLYSFQETRHPNVSDGGRACILGRLGSIMGMDFHHANEVARSLFHKEEGEFFATLTTYAYNGSLYLTTPLLESAPWVARSLREFAKRYAPQPLPAAIRAIFNPITEKELDHAII